MSLLKPISTSAAWSALTGGAGCDGFCAGGRGACWATPLRPAGTITAERIAQRLFFNSNKRGLL
jgi:hypothetical protein